MDAVRVLCWLVATMIGVYCSIIVFCVAFQRRYIYQRPARNNPPAVPLKSIAAGEFITVEAEDGGSVVAWHVPPANGKPVVIFLHGSADSPDHRATRFLALAAEGFGVIAPYFRGFDRSTGIPTEKGLLLDATAIYEYCRKLYPPQQIAIWGFSLGGAVAILLVARARVGALIVEASFTSLAAMAGHLLPFIPVRLILRDTYRADHAIATIASPVLIMHGNADRETPIGMGERLFEAAPEPKKFVRFAEGTHSDLDKFGASRVARAFLNSWLERP